MTSREQFDRGTPFAPRRVWFGGVRAYADWRLRYYVILADDVSFDAPVQRAGIEMALKRLPSPAITASRPGAGFVIAHVGAGQSYIVLNWWDNRNELFQRIMIAEHGRCEWRLSDGDASFCVWDTEVIAFERAAYIRSVLGSPAGPDIEAYLRASFEPSSAVDSLIAMRDQASFGDAWPAGAPGPAEWSP